MRADSATLVTIVGGYGDAFLALPSIREVARRCGPRQVYLLCPEAHISAFFTSLNLNYLPILAGEHTVTAADLAAVPVQHVISFNVYYPCEVDQLAGEVFADASWRGFFDRRGSLMVRPSALVNKHKRDQLFDVLGVEPVYDSMDRRMTLDAERIEIVTAFCQHACPPGGRQFYTLHLDTQDIKMWPAEPWITVVEHLWHRWRAWPIIIGKPTASARAIMRALPFTRSMFAYPEIGDQACGISIGRAFLGIDSMFAHVADSLQIPSVVLFGPFEPRVWGPIGGTSLVIQMTPPESLRELSPVDVIESLDRVLSGALA